MVERSNFEPLVEQALNRRQFLKVSSILPLGLFASALGLTMSLILTPDEALARTAKNPQIVKASHQKTKKSSSRTRGYTSRIRGDTSRTRGYTSRTRGNTKKGRRKKNSRSRDRYSRKSRSTSLQAKVNHKNDASRNVNYKVHSRAHYDNERSLYLYNIHTDETLDTVYWANGVYVPESLKELNKLFRDHYTGEIVDIDPQLFELLYNLCGRIDYEKPFHILSGYRCPATNAMLREQDSTVASHSLHMNGMAVDIRTPGLHTSHLRKAAVDIQYGGVGYYPGSDFVHIDTGPVRQW